MPALYGKPSSIRLRCKDFNLVAFQIEDEAEARKAYESIKALTCLNRVERLYAFSYQPPPAEKQVNGWEIYDPRLEFKRMGISPKFPDRGWRLSDINKDYQVRRMC